MQIILPFLSDWYRAALRFLLLLVLVLILTFHHLVLNLAQAPAHLPRETPRVPLGLRGKALEGPAKDEALPHRAQHGEELAAVMRHAPSDHFPVQTDLTLRYF